MPVRAREIIALAHPDGGFVVTNMGENYDPDDPLVRAHRWAFTDEAPIERATARPGEKRVTRAPGQ